MKLAIFSVDGDMDVIVVASGEVGPVGAAADGRLIGRPDGAVGGPDLSLPDEVADAVGRLLCGEPVGELPAAGDVGVVSGVEEDVAGFPEGVVAFGVLRVGVPAGCA